MGFVVENLTALLEVFDMPASVAFYRDILGFEVASTSGPEPYGWAMLRRPGALLMLNTLYDPKDERPAAPDPNHVAVHGHTSLYFNCPDVDAVYAHLRAKGCNASPPKVTHYGMKQVSLKDPDGYRLVFHH